jgi:hypothetical protein
MPHIKLQNGRLPTRRYITTHAASSAEPRNTRNNSQLRPRADQAQPCARDARQEHQGLSRARGRAYGARETREGYLAIRRDLAPRKEIRGDPQVYDITDRADDGGQELVSWDHQPLAFMALALVALGLVERKQHGPQSARERRVHDCD